MDDTDYNISLDSLPFFAKEGDVWQVVYVYPLSSHARMIDFTPLLLSGPFLILEIQKGGKQLRVLHSDGTIHVMKIPPKDMIFEYCSTKIKRISEGGR